MRIGPRPAPIARTRALIGQSVGVTPFALRRAGLVSLPLALVLGLAACGGSGGSGSGGGGQSAKPSVSDLINALESESTSKLTPAAAKCLATTMENSSLSNAALEAVIKNDKNYTPDAADKKTITAIEGKLTACIFKVLPSGAASALASASPSVGSLP